MAWRNPDDVSALTLSCPDPADLTTDVELLRLCYLLWDMSEGRYLPNPHEVALLPRGYVDDLFRWHQGVRFYEDYHKRPREMR